MEQTAVLHLDFFQSIEISFLQRDIQYTVPHCQQILAFCLNEEMKLTDVIILSFFSSYHRYNGGLTATAPSLNRARSLYQSSSSGARPSAKKVVFFLTDGRSNRGGNPNTPAAQLKAIGAQIYVLGKASTFKLFELHIPGPWRKQP